MICAYILGNLAEKLRRVYALLSIRKCVQTITDVTLYEMCYKQGIFRLSWVLKLGMRITKKINAFLSKIKLVKKIKLAKLKIVFVDIHVKVNPFNNIYSKFLYYSTIILIYWINFVEVNVYKKTRWFWQSGDNFKINTIVYKFIQIVFFLFKNIFIFESLLICKIIIV